MYILLIHLMISRDVHNSCCECKTEKGSDFLLHAFKSSIYACTNSETL
jgi:hypothetical protein